jgi:WD40 repeat protein
MDSRSGVFLVCTGSVYVIEGFTLRDGDVVDVSAETKTAGDTGFELREAHVCRRWVRDNIREVIHRRYLLRWVALELFSSDGRNHLLVFEPEDIDAVRKIMGAIADATPPYSITGMQVDLAADTAGTATDLAATSSTSATTATAFRRLVRLPANELDEMTQQWVDGRVSNFQYLMWLNTMAGRSYNDLTQYPVFPWVIADYESEELDLSSPATFRDLSKPVGALSPARAELFKQHYDNCVGVTEPHHYSHHYSSAAVVGYYLLRVEPFTKPFLDLNGGRWDWPDRLFHNVRETWLMLTTGTMPQVMELTPEFFYLPDFLVNSCRFAFGARQHDGKAIDDVTLPPWAHGSPREFVRKNLEALESPYVSARLNDWIDLVFGYKQRGQAAELALNVFSPFSYEGNIDIDSIADEVERRSTIETIRNFGQTPQQLWDRTPHPRRSSAALQVPAPPPWSASPGRVVLQVVGKASWSSGSGGGEAVSSIRLLGSDRVVAVAGRRLVVQATGRHIGYGYPDASVRVWGGDKILSAFQACRGSGFGGGVSCAKVTDDGGFVVTACSDGVVTLHASAHGGRRYRFAADLCGHYCAVTCLAVSRSQSFVVSGGVSGTCIIWDLNSCALVRELQHNEPLVCIDVHDVTGDIVACSARSICVWTINGELLAAQAVAQSPSVGEAITACAISREWVPGHGQVLLTGHRDGIVRVWDMERFDDPSPPSKVPGIRLKFVLPSGVASPISIIHVPVFDRSRFFAGNAVGTVFQWVDEAKASKKQR